MSPERKARSDEEARGVEHSHEVIQERVETETTERHTVVDPATGAAAEYERTEREVRVGTDVLPEARTVHAGPAIGAGGGTTFTPPPSPPVDPPDIKQPGGIPHRQIPIPVDLSRSQTIATADVALWWAITQSSHALAFTNYDNFMSWLLCGDALNSGLLPPEYEKDIKALDQVLRSRRFLPFTDTDAYRFLKVATEAFVSYFCAVQPENWARWTAIEEDDSGFARALQSADLMGTAPQLLRRWYHQYLTAVNGIDPKTGNKVLPYLAIIRRKLRDVPIIDKLSIFDGVSPDACYGILQQKLAYPCMIELIWSYWLEQGMLVQTMNVISRRFQNIRGPAETDPLAMVEIDPLRPLNNLMWGYIQDEQHRLTVLRRAYEYDHEYGLILEGRAVPPLRTADSRGKFLDSFHNLLYLASIFYRQDDDTTVVADAFPLLIALRDVHMLLAEGAHNQFGDMPATARVEMLMQQWLLARPEFRDVIPTRIMVDYPEPWMDRVDAMKRLQGWGETSILYFRDLAYYGEQILLSIRFGEWNNATADNSRAWARFFRTAVQSYIYAYRIVTGVDLTADVTQPQQRSLIATQPSVLMRQRLSGGSTWPVGPLGAATLPPPATPAMPPASPALPPAASPPGVQDFRQRRALRRP